jgi:hypothetical protein
MSFLFPLSSRFIFTATAWRERFRRPLYACRIAHCVCARLFLLTMLRASWSFAFFAALNCSREKHFDSTCRTVINKLLAGEIFSFIPCTQNASLVVKCSHLNYIACENRCAILSARCRFLYFYKYNVLIVN